MIVVEYPVGRSYDVCGRLRDNADIAREVVGRMASGERFMWPEDMGIEDSGWRVRYVYEAFEDGAGI